MAVDRPPDHPDPGHEGGAPEPREGDLEQGQEDVGERNDREADDPGELDARDAPERSRAPAQNPVAPRREGAACADGEDGRKRGPRQHRPAPARPLRARHDPVGGNGGQPAAERRQIDHRQQAPEALGSLSDGVDQKVEEGRGDHERSQKRAAHVERGEAGIERGVPEQLAERPDARPQQHESHQAVRLPFVLPRRHGAYEHPDGDQGGERDQGIGVHPDDCLRLSHRKGVSAS